MLMKIINIKSLLSRSGALKKHRALIMGSDLFDAQWYLDKNPDVKDAGIDPATHYLLHGAHEGRNPSIFFDGGKYLHANQDVNGSEINPLVHYLKYGRSEGREIQTEINSLADLPAAKKQGSDSAKTTGLNGLTRMGALEYGPIAKIMEFDSKEKIDDKNKNISICVQLHLFHAEQANEFARYLKNIDKKFTLLVSVQQKEDVSFWKEFFLYKVPSISECIVRKCPNIGRDVFPWVVLFREEILCHTLLVHVHTKESSYSNILKGSWRKFLLHHTLGSKGVVSGIYRLFAENEKIGLVYPPYYGALKGQPAWGACKEKMRMLADRVGMSLEDERCPDFPAGSFFWCRTDAMRPLLVSASISVLDFDPETGQIDGTFAHAVERFVGIFGQANTYKKVCVAVDVAYNLTHYWNRKRFAKINEFPTDNCVTPFLGNNVSISEKLKNLRIAVFTALTNNFDELVALPFIDEGIDYFCFTDTPRAITIPYANKITQYIDPNPRKTARFIKTHPHFYLPEYDLVIWIDANITPLRKLSEHVERFVDSDADIAVIEHPVRDGYVEEAMECIRIGADNAEIIQNQIEGYKDLGIKNNHLLETNIVMSRPKRDRVKNFFNLWWEEINTKSIRDQISANYAIEKSGVVVHHIFGKGISTHNHGDFLIFSHDLSGRDRVITRYLSDQQ